MDILQDAVVVTVTALLVLSFCSGVKLVCRKILKRDVRDKNIEAGDRT